MKKTLISAALALSLIAAPAFASDLAVNSVDISLFDVATTWTGPTAGLAGVVQVADGKTASGVAASVGYTNQSGIWLYGAEASLLALGDPAAVDLAKLDYYGQLVGKVGVAVTDNSAVYTLAGVQTNLPHFTDTHLVTGVGAEFRATDTVSVKAEYAHGFSVSGRPDFDRVTAGVVFKF